MGCLVAIGASSPDQPLLQLARAAARSLGRRTTASAACFLLTLFGRPCVCAGLVTITLNGTVAVARLQLQRADLGGSVAVHAAAAASVHVSDLLVSATAETPQLWLWLTASDGVTGGGDPGLGGWVGAAGSTFRTGRGFTSPGGNSTLAKWSFVGVGCRLWLPKGPGFGVVTVSVDGKNRTLLDLRAAGPTSSAAVFEWREAPGDAGMPGLAHSHALVMRWVSGEMVADGFEFLPPPISMV